MAQNQVIGKVKIEELAPKVLKLSMVGIWWLYSGTHFAKAIVEVSKTRKIVTMTYLRGWNPSLLLVVE